MFAYLIFRYLLIEYTTCSDGSKPSRPYLHLTRQTEKSPPVSTASIECMKAMPSYLPGWDGSLGGLSWLRYNLLINTCVLKPHSLPISGKLVIKDQNEAIVLRTRHILIDNGGEMHVGSALCPFQGHFSIVLYGR